LAATKSDRRLVRAGWVRCISQKTPYCCDIRILIEAKKEYEALK